MAKPLISVLIDTYNHERYIEQAIVSVLEQDFPAVETEIVVVDDGSTDRTQSIVQKFAPCVRYIRKENGGQASAFNVGIPQLLGQIVAFLDGDDWWAKQKLAVVAETFETHPSVAAVGHGFYEVRGTQPPLEMIVPGRTCHLDLSSVESARIADLGITLLATSRLSVRRAILDQIGPIPEGLVFCADMPIIALVLALGGAVVLDRPLCYYRLHEGNLCAHDRIESGGLRRKFEISEIFLKYIPERLAEVGIPSEVRGAFLRSMRFELDRLKARSGEAGRWDVFRNELQRFLTSYEHPSAGYVLFECFVATCALILPPTHFYELLDWYGRNNLKRFRRVLGTAEPSVPSAYFQRRAVPKRELKAS